MFITFQLVLLDIQNTKLPFKIPTIFMFSKKGLTSQKKPIVPNCTMSFFGLSHHRNVLRTSIVAQTDYKDQVSGFVSVRVTGYDAGLSRGHQPCKQHEYWFSPSTNLCTFKYSLSILFTPSPADESCQYYQ